MNDEAIGTARVRDEYRGLWAVVDLASISKFIYIAIKRKANLSAV